MTESVLIAVPTYRRAALLPPLVAAIRTQTDGLRTRILLVDNDPERSAEVVAGELGVEYLSETTPGIAAVRQAAVDAASDDELTVMIDDDVFPEDGWLHGLVDVWRETRAAVVMGYVRYVWPEGTDPWIAAGGFMRRTRFPNGKRLDSLATGNVLVDTAQVRALGVRFDVSLGLIGGEDNVFGRAVVARGGSIVASADSVARDDIALERTTREFVHRRAISHGQARVRLLIREAPAWKRPLLHVAHLVGGAVRWVAFTGGRAVSALRRDTAANAVYQRRAWFAQGRMLAALGIVRGEYARPKS
ncbi:glycosyltransferase family 2 protein [Microbacterium sp. NPDC057944]|uniref:glycosyltransferase family 2 protein n=1 Tax=Microbacterium sp. NPDC057944 TaxID=3346286 RepID=UPI0036D8FF51